MSTVPATHQGPPQALDSLNPLVNPTKYALSTAFFHMREQRHRGHGLSRGWS